MKFSSIKQTDLEHFCIGSKQIQNNFYLETFLVYFQLIRKRSKINKCKFLLDRLLPLLKEIRFIVKKGTKQFLLVLRIPQITIKFFLHFFSAKYKNEWKEHKF